jgi:hypothetical protein
VTNTVKDRVIIGIGLSVVERPRQLQVQAQTDEHSVVHTLYRLEKDGLASFKCKRNAHSPGKNLTKIMLTPEGVKRYKELTK